MAKHKNFEIDQAMNNDQLAYDNNKKSFELDVQDRSEFYDHPSDYETVANGAVDDDSTYDNSNPYVGDEYAGNNKLIQDNLIESGMHVDDGEIIKLNIADKILAKTPEDDRDDLDEEGYPKNDLPRS